MYQWIPASRWSTQRKIIFSVTGNQELPLNVCVCVTSIYAGGHIGDCFVLLHGHRHASLHESTSEMA